MNVPTPDPPAPIDPRLLAIRVKRVRQAKAALATVRHRLATYVSEHAPEQCGRVPFLDSRPCAKATDGFLLLTCGHFLFSCAEHGSAMLRAAQHGEASCTNTEHDLHIGARTVTLEWVGLA